MPARHKNAPTRLNIKAWKMSARTVDIIVSDFSPPSSFPGSDRRVRTKKRAFSIPDSAVHKFSFFPATNFYCFLLSQTSFIALFPFDNVESARQNYIVCVASSSPKSYLVTFFYRLSPAVLFFMLEAALVRMERES